MMARPAFLISSRNPTMRDAARRLANLLLAVIQAAIPALVFQGGFRTAPTGLPEPGPTPVEPAGYAFIIWSLIYAGSLAYAVFQALPRNAESPLLRRIGWLTASGFLLTSSWMVFASFGPLWATVPTMIGMFLLLAAAFVIAARWEDQAGRGGRRWFVVLPLALFSGWLTAAVFVNPAEVLPRYGFDRFGLSVEAFSIVVLGGAALAALTLLRLTRWNLAYALTVMWALAGIVVANVQRELSPAVAGTAAGIALVLAAVTVQFRVGAPRWAATPKVSSR
jgi:hypothetical protein